MDLTSITAIISILVGLISIFLGVQIIGRVAGKLKMSVTFLILAVIIFVIKESIRICFIDSFGNSDIFRSIFDIIIIIFITISAFNMKKMIDGVDGHHNHKKRKK